MVQKVAHRKEISFECRDMQKKSSIWTRLLEEAEWRKNRVTWHPSISSSSTFLLYLLNFKAFFESQGFRPLVIVWLNNPGYLHIYFWTKQF